MEKKILDVTCGSKTIWFDKNHPAAVYCDKRRESMTGIWKSTNRLSERACIVAPDVICDFTDLPFEDNTFSLVVFDPPHLKNVGENSWTYKKYGRLDENWPKMLHDGFWECMRVLKPDGILIFKWAETQIPAAEVWKAIGEKPLFGHHSGKKSRTFWACFMKIVEQSERVEKVWPGCDFCDIADFGEFGFEITKRYAKISCALGSWRFPEKEQFLFCPKCGKPIKDEAVEMVMKRLEELKDAES